MASRTMSTLFDGRQQKLSVFEEAVETMVGIASGLRGRLHGRGQPLVFVVLSFDRKRLP